MKTNTKKLVCIILLAVVLVSAVAVGVHQLVTRPEQITREIYETAFMDGEYDQVYLKNGKVTCVDFDGNRYRFTVEDPVEFDEYTRDAIDNLEIATTFYSDVEVESEEN